ncbi:MAG: hypoxanthine phosphoribosyltransferase [Rickettsiales bacterium]
MEDKRKSEDIKILFSAEEINLRVSELAVDISKKVAKDIMVISLLKGSFVFAADLIRALHSNGVQPQVDFMTLSSYGNNMTSSGKVEIIRDIVEDVKGRDVLIIDDIFESGNTLAFAANLIKERQARDVKIAIMLQKIGKATAKVKADFVGFEIDDKFVVGYGLDYANYYRELPYIGFISRADEG